MNGKYVECDYCGREEKTISNDNINSFRGFLKHKCNWVFIKDGNKVINEFCSIECCHNWIKSKP